MAKRLFWFLVLLVSFGSISSLLAQESKSTIDAQAFAAQWYQGKGEVTRYRLEQSRYGQVHSGDAVLVFVTEDFLPDLQVKHERGEKNNKVSVLHMNFVKKFTTGIYPYSLMASVFTPVSGRQINSATKSPGTLKVSSSAQEWCGNMYMQLNRRRWGYDVESHSYFQAEADQDFKLREGWLEDELWTQLRLQPKNLPTGKISITPGLQYVQLWHRPLQPETAQASLTSLEEKKLQKYQLEYETIGRTLEIVFESQFPHSIIRWEEKIRGKASDSWQVTKAERTHSKQIDYWSRHKVEDLPLRTELGLK